MEQKRGDKELKKHYNLELQNTTRIAELKNWRKKEIFMRNKAIEFLRNKKEIERLTNQYED